MPGVTIRYSWPFAFSISISARILAIRASSLMGITIPLVPSTEMPPSIPSLGLKVFFAISTPSGIDISTAKPPSYSKSPQTSLTASRIICLGTGLIAASPTGCCRPFFVTRPTPAPPSIRISFSGIHATFAYTRIPLVASGSSPASFRIAQEAWPSSIWASSTSRSRRIPLGVIKATVCTGYPESSISVAALAAAAAQEPVVYPQRSFLLFLNT